MKYKVLITGKNDSVIDGFFTQMNDYFEILSTSVRYEDMIGHMNYFMPDLFVCCLYRETQDQINKAAGIKRQLLQSNIPFVVIGTREDCARFEAGVPRVSNLTLCLPLDVNVMKEKLLQLIQKVKALKQASAEGKQISVKPPVQVESAGTGTGISQSPPKPVPSVEEPAPVKANVQPEDLVENAGVENTETTEMPERRELSTGLINEALTSEKAYEELLGALERSVALLEAGVVRRKHVLIVDDDAMMLKLMKEYLHDQYDVATALNGKIALKFLERKKTDLILLDYEMPGENGPAVLEQLRASVDTKDIPVILLTGVTEGKKIQEALALKPQSYLLKPVQRGKLVEAIEKVIR